MRHRHSKGPLDIGRQTLSNWGELLGSRRRGVLPIRRFLFWTVRLVTSLPGWWPLVSCRDCYWRASGLHTPVTEGKLVPQEPHHTSLVPTPGDVAPLAGGFGIVRRGFASVVMAVLRCLYDNGASGSRLFLTKRNHRGGGGCHRYGPRSAGCVVHLWNLRDGPRPDARGYDLLGVGSPVYYYRLPFNVTGYLQTLFRLEGMPAFIFPVHGSHAFDAVNSLGYSVAGRAAGCRSRLLYRCPSRRGSDGGGALYFIAVGRPGSSLAQEWPRTVTGNTRRAGTRSGRPWSARW